MKAVSASALAVRSRFPARPARLAAKPVHMCFTFLMLLIPLNLMGLDYTQTINLVTVLMKQAV